MAAGGGHPCGGREHMTIWAAKYTSAASHRQAVSAGIYALSMVRSPSDNDARERFCTPMIFLAVWLAVIVV